MLVDQEENVMDSMTNDDYEDYVSECMVMYDMAVSPQKMWILQLLAGWWLGTCALFFHIWWFPEIGVPPVINDI